MTDTEWKTATLDDVEAGQLVRLEHGDGSVLIRTAQFGDAHIDVLAGTNVTMFQLTRLTDAYGWSLFVPVPPKPTLPQADGTVIRVEETHLRFVRCNSANWLQLEGPGEKRFVSEDWLVAFIGTKVWAIVSEPPVVTATAILKRLSEIWFNSDETSFRQDVAKVAAEFGADLNG